MKITELQIQDIKRIKAVEIRPRDGEPVDGPNAGEVTAQAEMALGDDTDEQLDPDMGARG